MFNMTDKSIAEHNVLDISPADFLSKIAFTPPTYQRCPECGYHIGAIFRAIDYCKIGYFYSLILKNSNAKSLKSQMSMINEMLGSETQPIGWILNAFGITQECCRSHIICCMDPERSF